MLEVYLLFGLDLPFSLLVEDESEEELLDRELDELELLDDLELDELLSEELQTKSIN